MGGWKIGRVEEWVEGWKGGRLEEWVEEWKNGWKSGRLEGWKVGRLHPSIRLRINLAKGFTFHLLFSRFTFHVSFFTLLLTEKILDPSVAPLTLEEARIAHLSQQIRGAVLINGEQLATGVVVETLVGLQIGEELFLVGSRHREVGFVRLEGAIDFHRGETEHATGFIDIAPALRQGASDEQFSGFISGQAFD